MTQPPNPQPVTRTLSAPAPIGSASPGSASAAARARLDVGHKDRQILRRLAGRVAELAARPCEHEKRQLWYRHNALQPTRPLIYCDPENGWHEILTPDVYECEHPLAREWEFHFRKELFWGERMNDDKVIENRFYVPYVAKDDGWGVPIERHGGENGGSYGWTPSIRTWDDLKKLRRPTITVDYAATRDRTELARTTFGDLLNIRVGGGWWWSLGMTELLILLRGLEQVMMDMCAEPDGLHELMAFLRDAHLAKLDFLEANSLLTPNHDGPYVGSGGFGYTRELPKPGFDGSRCRTRDLWGFAESQETTSVSTEMFEEFIFPYQQPILDRFGLNCYGCCEPLHLRWSVVKRFPRLRRISVSPWADLEKMAEYLQTDYVYSMKPSPSDLAVAKLDEDYVRAKLRRAFEVAKGCRVEAVMKDNHTIGRNPENVIRWTRIAMEEAERIGA